MRKLNLLGLVIGFTAVASCYAYEFINTENYLSIAKAAITDESLKLQQTVDLRLPAQSKATPGKVSRHKTGFSGFSYSLFIVGNDEQSKQWLSAHAEKLKKIQAIGFVTNINTHEDYEALQALAEVPLLPANVDDLLLVLNESHYPLIAHSGEVWQ